MDFYRLYQYLKKGENIRHLHRDMHLLKDRFDGDRFDLLGAIHSPQAKIFGIYIDDDLMQTKQKIADSHEWRTKNSVDLCVITEQPKQYTEGLIVPYYYDKSHHFQEQQSFDVGSLLLGYFGTRSKQGRMIQLARELYKRL